jgi:hypothetical protein
LAPEDRGRVSVNTLEKSDSYAINGSTNTVKDALNKFYSNKIPSNVTIRLNGEAVSNFDQSLRNGDTIVVMASGLADGGIKGS